ncbi:MAG: tetratricopeptide repeat protein [Candidatus Aminicenantes bacterium]|nr:MAG: tetratricopeptide repeat protein [Candidatus Aminicenantes bacterium]
MYRWKKMTIYLGMFLIISISFPAFAHMQSDEELFQEAKIMIFDKEWENAQEKLEELLEDFSDSPLYSQALFYLGRTLENQKGEEKEAISVFKRYILRNDSSEVLTQEAETSIIKLSFILYERGRKSYLREIKTRLYRPNRIVRYYAALRLSYLEDKNEAREAVPILKEIMEEEEDEELTDKAKIALLRIDPDYLQEYEEKRDERRLMLMKFRVVNKRTGAETFSLSIPWALADLALANIPEDAKADLRKEGYDLDRIFKEVIEGGRILEIVTKETIIKIWVE